MPCTNAAWQAHLSGGLGGMRAGSHHLAARSGIGQSKSALLCHIRMFSCNGKVSKDTKAALVKQIFSTDHGNTILPMRAAKAPRKLADERSLFQQHGTLGRWNTGRCWRQTTAPRSVPTRNDKRAQWKPELFEREDCNRNVHLDRKRS